jgi:Tfp pilus assembly PilM family ATPase
MSLLPGLIVPKVKYFGLSIDRTGLRAVELTADGKVQALAEIIIPDDTFGEGSLAKPDVFVSSILQLFTAGKFTTPYVSVCFPEAYAYTRDHDVPDIPVGEIGEAVSWHAKDLFPFPQEDLYYDWKILEKKTDGYHVGVVAILKKMLDPMVDSLVAAGLKPLRFEPDASSTARLISLKTSQHALVTEVNKRSAYVTLVEGEKSLFTTVIAFTSDDTPMTYLTNITTTVKDIAAFYTKKGVLTEADTEVIVTGEVATNDWAGLMAKYVPYKIKILNTPVNNPAFNKAYAAATALIAPPEDENSINLMPGDVQAAYDRQWRMSYYRNVIVKGCIGLAVLCLIPLGVLLAVQGQTARLKAEVDRLTAVTKTSDTEIRKVTALNGQLESILSLVPLKATPAKKIDALMATAIPGITLTQWDFDDSTQQFSVSGTAATRNTLLEFRNRLEDTKEFMKITLPLEFLEGDKDIQFTITFLSAK